MATDELTQVIARYHQSVEAFIQGNPEPQKHLWSRREDVTLANPLGPPVRGWPQVEGALDRAASLVRDGVVEGTERISEVETADLAYIVEIERERIKIGGADAVVSASLRATSIFRREEGTWRLVHRHADPITAPRSIESLVER